MSSAQVIGHWTLGHTLGEGGFSKVKLGTHNGTGQKVALKILKDKNKMSKTVRTQVEREIATLTRIDHPNVLKLFEVDWEAELTSKKSGKTDTRIMLAIELAPGGELFEFLSYTGFFEEAIARTYFQQLIDGLEHCHSLGIVHRDLKPENLLLDDKFNLKIADFGLSNVVTATKKLMYTECGTPGYMAPEMFGAKDTGYSGEKADLWACGVILFIMLSGFPPFQRPSNSDWWFNKLAHNKHSLFWQAHSRSAYFSDQTKDFINKILNPDPTKRMTIQDIKKHPWYNGSIVSKSRLTQELQTRKATVDQVKEREREKKAQEEASLGEVVMRGEGGTDVLPQAPPSLSIGGFVFAKPTRGSDEEDVSFEEADGETHRQSPKPLDATIARYTRFDSGASPDTIMERLKEVLTSNAVKFSENKKEYRLQCKYQETNFAVEIFAHPSTKETYVVEFRRTQGASMDFLRHFGFLRAQMADLIQQPVKA